LAKKDADAKRLVGEIRAASEWNDEKLRGLFVSSRPLQERLTGATTPAEADAVRSQYARRALKRSIDDLIQLLRTGLEPEPDLILQLAEAVEVACAILAESARDAVADHQDIVAEALLPAARSAVTLSDFVNVICAKLAADAHADGCGGAERWPRIHYANARRNTANDELFHSWKVGAGLLRKQTPQDKPDKPIATARDRTLEAMCRLLPETMRRCYPVFPVLFDRDEKLIAPTTATGALAEPYKALARFLAVVRHSEDKEARSKALRDFLATNDNALEKFARDAQIQTDYANTRDRIIAEVERIDAEADSTNPKPVAWLRPMGPKLSFASGSR